MFPHNNMTLSDWSLESFSRPVALLVVSMETVRQTNQSSVITIHRLNHWLEIKGNIILELHFENIRYTINALV